MLVKHKQVILDELRTANLNDVTALELRETYLQRKLLGKDARKQMFSLELGQVQTELKFKKDFVDFLNDYEKEV